MSDAILLGVAAFTSIVAIGLLRARGVDGLLGALGVLCEAVGATVLFFVANVALGATFVLLARRLWFYTTLYDVTDISLLLLSLFQALVTTTWLRTR